MSSKDTASRTVLVAGVLCFVCSIAVSVAAVSLKPIQEKNKALDKKKNILMAAGLYQEGADIGEIFNSKIKAKLVDLETGEPTDKFDPLKFDQKKAAKDANLGVAIPSDKDIAGIKRRSKYAVVYEVLSPEGGLEQVVLPVHGKGLWSTMYGFLAINADSTTIQGIGYYQHGETPGLGGEVDNPRWKAIWKGKKLFNEQWDLTLEVIKGAVDSSRDDAKYKIDGLAGATLTTRGVDLMIKYWLGPEGFEKFLQSMRQGGGV